MKQKILVIDDDKVMRDLCRITLEENGYEVFELESGDRSLGIIEQKLIDLVVLDVFMEGKEGVETIRDIRKVFHTLPVIAVSSDETFLKILEQFGANTSLPKPIELDLLLVKVRELLERVY